LVKSKNFNKSEALTPLSRDIIALYATLYTHNDVKEALRFLGAKDRKASRNDLRQIYFFVGMIFVMILITIALA
jgi:hypothetical protein